jgi:hypothetical protein
MSLHRHERVRSCAEIDQTAAEGQTLAGTPLADTGSGPGQIT